MANRPKLNCISVPRLIAAAGDPWEVNATLQAGKPGAIAELSRAFASAGGCTAETLNEFNSAQARFRASWDRGMGPHPINDSTGVQLATLGLTVQRSSLPQIGVTLAGIAADLAETQRFSKGSIGTLNTELRYVDALIDQALQHQQEVSDLEDSAIALTANTFNRVDALREDYTTKLTVASMNLRANYEYDPAEIEGIDGDGEPSLEQRGRDSVEWYGANQREKDEALVASSTTSPSEIDSATARLRDFTAAIDSAGEGRTLAGERLDDFRMANFAGLLPRDPLMGGDARDRARDRLAQQHNLELGIRGVPPMTPNQATQFLNESEKLARVKTTQQAIAALRNLGISKDGAWKAISEVIHSGTEINGHVTLVEHPLKGYGTQPPKGLFAAITNVLSPEDASTWGKFAKRLGTVGNVIELTTTAVDLYNGGTWEDAGGSVGGVAGGLGAGALATAVITTANPIVGGVIIAGAAFAGSKTGEEVGKWVGKQFDPVTPAAGSGN